jgi:hypothetical protein
MYPIYRMSEGDSSYERISTMVIGTCTSHRRLSMMDIDPSRYIKRRLMEGSVECAISVMDDRMTYQDTIDRVIDISAPRYRITS